MSVNKLIPKLDFDVLDTYSVGILRIADLSVWKHLSEEATYLDITTPGKKTATTYEWTQGKIHYFNGTTLETNCDEDDDECDDGCLPDGIYKLKLYVCEGEKFYKEKCYLRTVKSLLRLDEILISMALNCCLPDKKIMDKYLEIELLIKSAHANLRNGNILEASCHYEKAVDLLDDFENCVKDTTGTSSCKTITTKSCS